MPRRTMEMVKVSVSMPLWVQNEINSLSDEMNTSRSDVISEILEYVIENEDVLNDIFPMEDEELGE